MTRSFRIGLTGGIGSGKSSLAAEWVACGAVLVDTDAIARELTVPGGAALPSIAKAFGSELIGADGALDRSRMRSLVFADPTAKQTLEAILHPLIGEQALAQAQAAGERTVVFDVPLMTESSAWRARVQRIAVVDCSAETQIQRVMQRNGWSRQMVEDIIRQQAPRERRRRIADAVIYNDGINKAALAALARQLWRLWVGPLAGPQPGPPSADGL